MILQRGYFYCCIDVTNPPYNADNMGESDVTAVIRKAIDDCFENGGGTVWLPEGRYNVAGNIHIKKFITLRGDYQKPDEGNDYGTIIIADVEISDRLYGVHFKKDFRYTSFCFVQL